MTIILTGGGSGGHVTPIIAIASELKKLDPGIKLIYIGQKGDRFADIPAKDKNIDETYLIRAGKFRRFHGEGLKQLLDMPNLYKNTRDLFYVVIGTFQAKRLVKRLNPDIIFSRGGYVSVPVAFGGRLNHVPYITHDSDPVPSLANRIIAPWAKINAVALPKEIYPYKQSKTVTTGVPVSDKFVEVTEKLKESYRAKIGIPKNDKLVFIIGGGLGSQTINNAIADVMPHLIKEHSNLHVIHVAGATNEATVKESYGVLSTEEMPRVKVYGYLDDVYLYSGAADLVITRAGATNLAEFAIQAKPIIVIPSSFLTGGHQLKSAEFLETTKSAIIIGESELIDNSNKLAQEINKLLSHPDLGVELKNNLVKLAKPDATKDIATLILSAARP